MPSSANSRTKNQPKTSVRALKILKKKKNKHVGTGIHDPKTQTSTTLRDFPKLRSEKLRAELSFPTITAGNGPRKTGVAQPSWVPLNESVGLRYTLPSSASKLQRMSFESHRVSQFWISFFATMLWSNGKRSFRIRRLNLARCRPKSVKMFAWSWPKFG